MSSATDHLCQYAEYHRDRRNIATHLAGIPLIVFAVGVLLARPAFTLGNVTLTPAWLLFVLLASWWLTRGNLVLGLVVSAATGLLVLAAGRVAALGQLAWLAVGIASFVAGWAIQFVGHYYEGRKPAFFDDVRGLMVGPMFVVAETMFALGWNRALQEEIVRRAGPVRLPYDAARHSQ